MNTACCEDSGYFDSGRLSPKATRPAVSKPGSTRISLSKLRIRRPAPARSTTASATSITTSARRAGRLAALLPVRPLSRNRFPSSGRTTRRAGRTPKNSVVRSVTPSAKTSTMPSSCTAASRGMSDGAEASRTLSRRAASPMPSAAPRRATSELSVTSCRTSRPRPAPSAVRTASSPWRDTPRTRARFATFAQAMSRTNATHPSSTESGRVRSPVIHSCIGMTSARRPVFWSG